MDIIGGSSCVPDDDFISETDVGSVYYSVALCCGSSWLSDGHAHFFSMGSYLLAMLVIPLFSSLGRELMKFKKKKALAASGTDRDIAPVKEASSLLTGVIFLDAYAQLALGVTSLGIFWFAESFDVHKVNASCKTEHCYFLTFISSLLYKPFNVALFNAVTAFFEASNIVENTSTTSGGCLNCLAGFGMAVGTFIFGALAIVYVLPIVGYSMVLLILGLPIYLAMAILMCGTATAGYLISVTVSPPSEAERKQLETKLFVRFAFIAVMCYAFVTLTLSKLYFGCGWKFTAVNMFQAIVNFGVFSLGIEMPGGVAEDGTPGADGSDSMASLCIMVSLVLKVLLYVLKYLIKRNHAKVNRDTEMVNKF